MIGNQIFIKGCTAFVSASALAMAMLIPAAINAGHPSIASAAVNSGTEHIPSGYGIVTMEEEDQGRKETAPLQTTDLETRTSIALKINASKQNMNEKEEKEPGTAQAVLASAKPAPVAAAQAVKTAVVNENVSRPAQSSSTNEAPAVKSSQAPSSAPSTSVLTASKGVNMGPSGKETYYNLDMSGIVNAAHTNAWGVPAEYLPNISGEYWIREDGVKMLGDYAMVAVDLSVHPRGSLLQTSVGTAVAVDTGSFCHNGSGVSVDIATNW